LAARLSAEEEGWGAPPIWKTAVVFTLSLSLRAAGQGSSFFRGSAHSSYDPRNVGDSGFSGRSILGLGLRRLPLRLEHVQSSAV